MATFDDLEFEVKKLRRTVRRLESGNSAAANARAVSEIVSEQNGDEKLITRGGSPTGFASACAESHAKLASRAEQKLIADIRAGQSAGEISRKSLYRQFVPILGRSRVDELILEHRR